MRNLLLVFKYLVDILNYHNYPPCFSVNADVGVATIQNVKLGNGPLTSSTHFPSFFEDTCNSNQPNSAWGSCEISQEDGG